MDRQHVIDKLKTIFTDFFNDENLTVTEEFQQEDYEDWDSVAHIQLILEIENEFGLVFEAEDIPGLVSILGITDKIISLNG